MKKILILLMALSLAGLAFADVIIGTGTSTGRYPLNDYYVYSRSQCIYTADEIGVPAGGTITHLRWYRDDTGADPSAIGTTEIWLAETTSTTLSTWQTEGTLVATISNIDLGAGGGWYEVDITDFTYTGSNLMVTVRTQDAPFTSPHSYWRYTSTSPDYRSLLGNSDYDNPPDVSISYSRPNITLVGITQTTPPGICSLIYPTPSGVTDVGVTPTLSWASGTGNPTGYDVYFGETLPAEGSPNADHMVQTGTTWSPGTLSYSTTYSWKIVPWNANGHPAYDDCPTWSFTTRADPTITTFPWEVDFGTTTAEWPVPNWSQLTGLYGGTPAAGTQWYQNDFCNITDPVNKSASINIWSTTTYGWLVTPPVNIPAGDYELKFEIGLTTYSGTGSPTPGGQPDDRFILAYDDDPLMSSPTIIREWNNTGSSYVYDNVSNTGETHTIDLDALGISGVQYFAFYGESTVSNGDNNFYVDNVIVRETPTTPVITVTPDSWDFGFTPIGGTATQQFTISNTGTGTLNITALTIDGTYYSLAETPTLPVALATGEIATFTVEYAPLVAGTHTGTVVITDDRATTTVDLTGTAYQPATLPLTEDWESGWGDWTVVNGTQTNAWYIGTADPYEGTNSAYISNDAGVSNAYTITTTSVAHVYKDIAFDADCLEFPLSFYWKCQGESSYDYLRVHLVETSVTPVAGTLLSTGQLAQLNQQNTWQNATITIPGTHSGTVKRLVFTWRNDSSVGTQPPINLDNISLSAVPVPTGPVLAPNLDYPADAQDNLPIGGFPFQFSWNTGGSEPDQYNLYLAYVGDLPTNYTEDDFFAAASPYEDVTSPYTPTFTYNYSGHYVWTVSAYNVTYPTEVYQWPPYEFIIQPDPTITVFPHLQDYEVWPPLNWDLTGGTYSFVQYLDGTGNNWAKANFWSQTEGNTDIMTSPPILSTTDLRLNFTWSHQYNTSYPNDALTVQISADGTTWTDLWYKGAEDLESNDGALSTTPGTGITETLMIPTTYTGSEFWLRFYAYSGWGPDLFIDDFYLDIPLDHDVKPVSIGGIPGEVVTEEPITPTAVVTNIGLNAESFSVSISWDTYSNTQYVSNLGVGETATVTFATFTPTANVADQITVTTLLATDMDTSNDQITKTLICLPLNVAAVANDVWQDVYISFNLQNPGTQTALPTPPTYENFMAGADWAENNWLGCEYDDGTLASDTFNDIDAITGATTYIGDMGYALMGIAYDDNTDTMYGTDGTSLYIVDVLTGVATLVGLHNNVYDTVTGLMIDIAYDNTNNILYGIDLGLDCLWIINTTTGNCDTLVGFLGIDINYAQDAAFDQDNGNLYLAGYAGSPVLYWIDTATGGAYKIGNMTSETTAFAIPYGSTAVAPEIAIGTDGTVSWAAVPNAVAYNIYAADDPYGTYTLVATTPNTNWLDPAYPEAMKFYKVTSLGGRTNEAVEIQYNIDLKKPVPASFTDANPGLAPQYPVKDLRGTK